MRICDLVAGFGGAGVSPAVLRRDAIKKIAGGTPAPRKPALHGEARDRRTNCLKRCKFLELGNRVSRSASEILAMNFARHSQTIGKTSQARLAS